MLIGTWPNLLRSLSGLTGFDHVTNQVHIPVNFSTYLFISDTKLIFLKYFFMLQSNEYIAVKE